MREGLSQGEQTNAPTDLLTYPHMTTRPPHPGVMAYCGVGVKAFLLTFKS